MLFAGEVAGGENNSNLFTTPTATYLPLLLLGQPISKSHSRCPSLLSLREISILEDPGSPRSAGVSQAPFTAENHPGYILKDEEIYLIQKYDK